MCRCICEGAENLGVVVPHNSQAVLLLLLLATCRSTDLCTSPALGLTVFTAAGLRPPPSPPRWRPLLPCPLLLPLCRDGLNSPAESKPESLSTSSALPPLLLLLPLQQYGLCSTLLAPTSGGLGLEGSSAVLTTEGSADASGLSSGNRTLPQRPRPQLLPRLRPLPPLLMAGTWPVAY